MDRISGTCALIMCLSLSAHADVWRWVDAEGDTHFVDTMTSIYTWTDEFGKRYYSDTPDHEDAVSVELVWHSPGSLKDVANNGADGESDDDAYPGETEEQRVDRKRMQAHFCERATEIYDSYVNAPQLYRTGEDGEREYLNKQEAAKMIAETRAKKDELCS